MILIEYTEFGSYHEAPLSTTRSYLNRVFKFRWLWLFSLGFKIDLLSSTFVYSQYKATNQIQVQIKVNLGFANLLATMIIIRWTVAFVEDDTKQQKIDIQSFNPGFQMSNHLIQIKSIIRGPSIKVYTIKHVT